MDFSAIIGKVFTSVINVGDEIYFSNQMETYILRQTEDEYDSIWLKNATLDFSKIEGSCVLVVEEFIVRGPGTPFTFDTWVYKFETNEGFTNIQFVGDSFSFYQLDMELVKTVV